MLLTITVLCTSDNDRAGVATSMVRQVTAKAGEGTGTADLAVEGALFFMYGTPSVHYARIWTMVRVVFGVVWVLWAAVRFCFTHKYVHNADGCVAVCSVCTYHLDQTWRSSYLRYISYIMPLFLAIFFWSADR